MLSTPKNELTPISLFADAGPVAGVGYPFGPTHLNVKTLFALSKGLLSEAGTRAAVEAFGLPFEGTHHRGDDDAWNIAAVLAEVLRMMRVKPE